MPIVIDSRDLQKLRYRLERASKNLPRDMQRALSNTQRATKTQAGREMSEVYTAGKQAIGRRTQVRPVNTAALSFSVIGSKKPIELQEYKHSVTKRSGARVQVFKASGAQALPHAFRRSAGKSRIFQRVKAAGGGLVGRLPIKVLRGPSAADMLIKKAVQEKLGGFVMNKLSKEIIRLTEASLHGKG